MDVPRSRPSTPRGDRAEYATGESHRPGCAPGTMNPSGRARRKRSRSASQPATSPRLSHIQRAPWFLGGTEQEGDSFTRVSSTNEAEWPDQNGSGESPVSPFGISGTSENREVASPIASARRPATAASSGNGDEDMLTRIRNLRVIQGDGYIVRQATDVVMTEEARNSVMGVIGEVPPETLERMQEDVRQVAIELMKSRAVLGQALTEVAMRSTEHNQILAQKLNP